MAWILSEDAAVKARLQGLLVNDATSPPGGREVGVRFRLPEDELADLTYPVIIIEHAGVYPAQERMHSGYAQLSSAPEGYAPWWAPGEPVCPAGSPYWAPVPTPYNLDYQVTVFGRFFGAHMAPLIAQLAAWDRLPAKLGRLPVPQDGTTRTMRLLGGPEEGYGSDEDGKKIFKVVYLVRVFSELAENIASSIGYGGTLVPVNTVSIDLDVYRSLDSVDLSSPAGLRENIGILSAGAASRVNVQESS